MIKVADADAGIASSEEYHCNVCIDDVTGIGELCGKSTEVLWL